MVSDYGKGEEETGGVEIKGGKQQLKKSNINVLCALIVYEKASNESLKWTCSFIHDPCSEL